MNIDDLIKSWSKRKANISCNEVIGELTVLGFEIRDGSRGGHKVFTHDKLINFYSASFNCGHGKNPILKKAYITAIIRTLRKYQLELERLQEKDNE